MLQFSWLRVTYVDAGAGPGRYETGEEGSPVFALDRLQAPTASHTLRHAACDRVWQFVAS
jgi:hypothetical protein